MADDQPQQDRQGPGHAGGGQTDQNQGQGQDQQTGQDQNGKRQRANPKRKRMFRFILLALVVVGVIVAIPLWAYYSSRESTDDAEVDGHIVPVSPRINGTIMEVLVADNQTVHAGQKLVLLDPADYEVAVSEAQAALVTAEANTAESQVNVPITDINTSSQIRTTTSQVNSYEAAVASAEQVVNTARARLGVSKAALAQAEANYQKAQQDLVRYKDLVSKDEISRQDYDAAVAAAGSNSAQVDSAKAEIVASQHTLDQAVAQLNQARAQLQTALVDRRLSQEIRPRQEAVSEARYKQAQAQVQQRQADLNQAKLNLGYTIIRAAVDGVVSRKSAEPGMPVSPGQQIMALVPLDDVWVTANYKETQLKSVRVGQKVEISVDTYGGRTYRGYVDSIAAASGAKFSILPPENATGNYVKVVQRIPVKIELEPGENRDHSLRPGMSVEPTILLNSGTNNAY